MNHEFSPSSAQNSESEYERWKILEKNSETTAADREAERGLELQSTFKDLAFQTDDPEYFDESNLSAMAAIAGVFADVKPAAFCNVRALENNYFDPDQFRANLKSLGIYSYFQPEGHSDTYDADLGTWYLSKDPQNLKLLQDIREDYSGGDDRERALGKLLGYPETATEYFIKRSHSEAPFSPPPQTDYVITNYIHDPAHLQAECDAYERPITEALQKYCPQVLL